MKIMGTIKQYHIIIGDHDRKRAKRCLFVCCFFFSKKGTESQYHFRWTLSIKCDRPEKPHLVAVFRCLDSLPYHLLSPLQPHSFLHSCRSAGLPLQTAVLAAGISGDSQVVNAKDPMSTDCMFWRAGSIKEPIEQSGSRGPPEGKHQLYSVPGRRRARKF